MRHYLNRGEFPFQTAAECLANVSNNHDEQFVRDIAANQRRLYAFILRLVPKTADALDLLQETNMVLWKKKQDFRPGTDFGAWACRVAHYTVLTYRKKISREHLLFDDELLGLIAAEAHVETGNFDEHLVALAECLQKLPPKDRDLLERRYADNLSPRHIAQAIDRTARAVAQALYRIRGTLLDCIDRTLAEGVKR